MSINYTINEELNGIEIKFSEKPTPKVLAEMKKLGFRWSPNKGVWYARKTDERLKFAEYIAKESNYEQLSLFPTEEPKAEPKVEVKEVKAEPKKEPTKVTEMKPKTKAKTTKAKAEPKAEPKKDNVIEFAKARPDIKVRMALDENATLEECIEKINKEKALFRDSDSTFVLDGLLEMCKVNPNFRNNFMQESKTFMGAFSYFMNLAKQGFAHKMNGVAYLDNNLALGFAMDYYNMIEE